jgi:hypothetical protein
MKPTIAAPPAADAAVAGDGPRSRRSRHRGATTELYARGMLQNGRTPEISAQTRDLILQNRSARLNLIAQTEKLIFN